MGKFATAVTTEHAFVRAICERPDDDTPRLVFADWLEEHATAETCGTCGGLGIVCCCGKPLNGSHDHNSCGPPEPCNDCSGTGRVGNGYADRAEFIRKSIDAARDDRENGWTLQPQLHHPRKELFRLPSLTAGEYRYRRGFVSKLVCPVAAFTADLARAVWSQQPVTAVTLSGARPYHNGSGAAWFDVGRTRPAHAVPSSAELPGFLFSRLSGHRGMGGGRWKSYETEALAMAALSAACVAYGRAAGVTKGGG